MGSTLGAGFLSLMYTFNKELATSYIRSPILPKVIDFCEQRPVTAAVIVTAPACYIHISEYLEDSSPEKHSKDVLSN